MIANRPENHYPVEEQYVKNGESATTLLMRCENIITTFLLTSETSLQLLNDLLEAPLKGFIY